MHNAFQFHGNFSARQARRLKTRPLERFGRKLLFRRLLFALGERKALRFFAACFAFPNVVSALAVSHKTLTLTRLSRRSKFAGGSSAASKSFRSCSGTIPQSAID
jgi:hypothetical protein